MRWILIVWLASIVIAGCGLETWTFGSGSSSSCRTNNDCAPGTVCDTPNGVCVECLSNRDCLQSSSKWKCATTLNRCVECGVDSDCRPPYICDSALGQCVAPCSDGSCGSSACADPAGCPEASVSCNEAVTCGGDAQTDGATLAESGDLDSPPDMRAEAGRDASVNASFDAAGEGPVEAGPGAESGADVVVDVAPPCGGSCSGLTPYCLVASNRCVGCLGDQDCQSHMNCDPVYYYCVLED